MNRSIFQIWQFFLSKLIIVVLLFLFSLIVFYFVQLNFVVNCTDIKNLYNFSKYSLRVVIYNKHVFLASNSINENDAKKTFEIAANQYFNGGFKTGISKYYLKKDNVLIPFPKKSSYSHPNIFLGTFNNNFVNFQLTHNKLLNFIKFTPNDLIFSERLQFICNMIQIYDGNLNQLMLNHNDLNLNNQYTNENSNLIILETKNSLQIQKYLDNNIENMTEHFQKVLD